MSRRLYIKNDNESASRLREGDELFPHQGEDASCKSSPPPSRWREVARAPLKDVVFDELGWGELTGPPGRGMRVFRWPQVATDSEQDQG